MGESEKATPYQALQAITINAAYEFFEEDSKGSIEEGKLADFVIFEKNPLSVDAMTIKDIEVAETIKEGRTIFEKK
nr:amidohydrolase family protein [Membranihabitans marinus]